MRAARPRPAYVDIPLDLLAETTTLRPERFAAAPAPTAPPAEALGRAQQLLSEARRPLIIAGGGARSAGAPLRHLVEALDGYLVTTTAAKGVLAESHPANLGASLPYRVIQDLAAAADVIVAAGTEISETDMYTSTRLPLNGRLVRIDVDERKLADHFEAEVRIRRMRPQRSRRSRTRRSRARAGVAAAGEAGIYRAQIEREFDRDTRGRLAALQALRAALPADGAVFSDMTQIAYLGNYAFRAERPGLWFHPSGYGALGYALPAAIGAKVAQPERAIVALAGDFGVQFTHQELMTAVELDLTLPLIVWNNEALGQIRDDMRAAGIAPIGVVGRNPDFVALASACGAAGVRVHNAARTYARGARRARPLRSDARGSGSRGLPPALVSTAAAPSAARSPLVTSSRSKIQLAFAVIYLVWGVTYAVNRIMALALPPLLAAGSRFLLAGVFLTCLARARGLALPRSARDWRSVTLAAVLGIVLSNGLSVLSLRHMASNQAALINSSSAFWIAWLGMYGRRAAPVSVRTWVGLTLGFVGVAVLVSAKGFGAHAQVGWQLLVLIASLSLGTRHHGDPRIACRVRSAGLHRLLPAGGRRAARRTRTRRRGCGALGLVGLRTCLYRFSGDLQFNVRLRRLHLFAAARNAFAHRHLRLRQSAGRGVRRLATAG